MQTLSLLPRASLLAGARGCCRPRSPLPRDAGPSPALGGVGTALSFQEHSPEVTLGEASYCPVAKHRNHSAEGGAPPSPCAGPAGAGLPGAGPHRVHVSLASGGASQKVTPLLPGQASSPASTPPTSCDHRTRGRGGTRSPTPTVAARPAAELRARGEPGVGAGVGDRGCPLRSRPAPPRPPATAPLFRRPIGGLLD